MLPTETGRLIPESITKKDSCCHIWNSCVIRLLEESSVFDRSVLLDCPQNRSPVVLLGTDQNRAFHRVHLQANFVPMLWMIVETRRRPQAVVDTELETHVVVAVSEHDKTGRGWLHSMDMAVGAATKWLCNVFHSVEYDGGEENLVYLELAVVE